MHEGLWGAMPIAQRATVTMEQCVNMYNQLKGAHKVHARIARLMSGEQVVIGCGAGLAESHPPVFTGVHALSQFCFQECRG